MQNHDFIIESQSVWVKGAPRLPLAASLNLVRRDGRSLRTRCWVLEFVMKKNKKLGTITRCY